MQPALQARLLPSPATPCPPRWDFPLQAAPLRGCRRVVLCRPCTQREVQGQLRRALEEALEENADLRGSVQELHQEARSSYES